MDTRLQPRRMEHGGILKMGADMADMLNSFARFFDGNVVCNTMLAYAMLVGLVREKQVMLGHHGQQGHH